MPLNPFFNFYPGDQVTSEQNLIEDLLIESLKIYGMDIYYLPRGTRDSVDYLFGEDPLKQYTKAYPLEMYLENVTAMQGEGDFISKFGLEIRDEMSFLVARRRFKQTVPNLIRPNEGDLIYVPLVQNFFEITFVEHENDQAMFYTLGRGRHGNVYVYALKMKQFVFSNEIIMTGIPEIDLQIRDSYQRTRLTFSSMVGNFTNDSIVFQGASLESANAQGKVYSSGPNYVDLYLVQGQFLSGNVSSTTGSTGVITLSDNQTLLDDAFEDIIDNNRIDTEADKIIDFSVQNPFGTP